MVSKRDLVGGIVVVFLAQVIGFTIGYVVYTVYYTTSWHLYLMQRSLHGW